MTTAVQRRRGTTTEHASFTGLEGEISVNTTKETLVVHDGSTAGGFELARADGSNFVATSVDINGGTIDGTTIGASSASTGAFTTLTASGEITANGGIALGDNDKATFGAGSDLQIYHDGSNSRIVDTGTGDLSLEGANIRLRSTNGDVYAYFSSNEEAELYYNGSPKLSTTATGIDVTGTATMDGLVVDGAASVVATLNTSVNGSQLLFNDATAGTQPWNFGIKNDGTNDFLLYNLGAENLEIYTSGDLRQKIASNGDISFYEDTGTTPKFFWDASAEQLDISGAGGLTVDAGVQITANVGFNAALGGRLFKMGTHGLVLQGVTGSANNFAITTPAGELLITNPVGTNDVALVTTGGGNVGIGTSTPSSTLHLKPTVDSTNGGLRLESTDGSQYATIDMNNAGNLRFYQNGTPRMRISSSGDLLLGTTTTTFSDDGVRLYNYGNIEVVRPNDSCMELNRTGSDGIVARFHKDGTTVGSIGTFGGDLTLGTGTTQLRFNDGLDIIIPSTGAAARDATIGLGSSTNRFKDLYLSGGVYLGGTGAANKLDDYEEGTWTPTLEGDTSGSAPLTVTSASYTKIGNTVHAYCYLSSIDLSADDIVGNMVIKGLPFNVSTNNLQSVAITYQALSATYLNMSGRLSSGFIRLHQDASNFSLARTDCVTTSGKVIMVGCTYPTNA